MRGCMGSGCWRGGEGGESGLEAVVHLTELCWPSLGKRAFSYRPDVLTRIWNEKHIEPQMSPQQAAAVASSVSGGRRAQKRQL
jgi:hypothetical protein